MSTQFVVNGLTSTLEYGEFLLVIVQAPAGSVDGEGKKVPHTWALAQGTGKARKEVVSGKTTRLANARVQGLLALVNALPVA